MDELKRAARSATRGALVHCTGYAIAIAVALVMTILVPGILGSEDFGRWVFFRSIIILLISLTVLGGGEILGRFYVEMASSDRGDEAGRIFKAVALARFAAGLVAAVVGVFLLLAGRERVFGLGAAVMLGVCVVLKNTAMTLGMLLRSQRRMARNTIMMVLNSCVVQISIVLAYLAGKTKLIPLGCMIGDTVLLLVVLALVRGRVPWPKGWMKRNEWSPLLRFGIPVTVVSIASLSYYSLAPYLMGLLGIGVSQIGYFGLAIRCEGLFAGALLSLGAALFPFLTVVLQQQSLDRALSWQSLLCRMGALLSMGAAAFVILLGDRVVPAIWGSDFAPVSAPLVLCFLAILPYWIGIQHGSACVLLKKPASYALATVAGLLSSLVAFFVLTPGMGSIGAAIAHCTGNFVFMIVAMIAVRRIAGRGLKMGRIWLPFLAVIALWPVRMLDLPTMAEIAILVAWSALFAALSFLSGSVRMREIRDILSHVDLVALQSPSSAADDGVAGQ